MKEHAMRKTATVLVLALLCAYTAQAHAVYLHNRSGGMLCVAETRDEPDPFDHDVARITGGWKCVDDLGTLVIERSDGILDIAIKKADGTDYVANSSNAFKKTKTFVPKDSDSDVFGLVILKFTAGWVTYSWMIGPDDEWSSFKTLDDVRDLPATLDAFGFKEFDAWQLDAQQSGLEYILN